MIELSRPIDHSAYQSCSQLVHTDWLCLQARGFFFHCCSWQHGLTSKSIVVIYHLRTEWSSWVKSGCLASRDNCRKWWVKHPVQHYCITLGVDLPIYISSQLRQLIIMIVSSSTAIRTNLQTARMVKSQGNGRKDRGLPWDLRADSKRSFCSTMGGIVTQLLDWYRATYIINVYGVRGIPDRMEDV